MTWENWVGLLKYWLRSQITYISFLALDDETPCKPSLRQIEDTDRPFSRASLTSSPDSHSTISTRSSRVGRSFTYPSRHAGNATFLTECSFGIAHDKLVEIITDIEPFNPHWDQLKSIDLRGKKANSVARLKEFLPNLDEINLYVRTWRCGMRAKTYAFLYQQGRQCDWISKWHTHDSTNFTCCR